jgi:hypothetical protein
MKKLNSHSNRFASLALFIICFSTADAFQTRTPKPGTPERKAIMDALRQPVMKVVKQKVIFNVGHLKVEDGWAFMMGNAVKEDGSSLGDEFLWGEVSALLRLKSGKWEVLQWSFATDTSGMEEAMSKYPAAPRSIFP